MNFNPFRSISSKIGLISFGCGSGLNESSIISNFRNLSSNLNQKNRFVDNLQRKRRKFQST